MKFSTASIVLLGSYCVACLWQELAVSVSLHINYKVISNRNCIDTQLQDQSLTHKL